MSQPNVENAALESFDTAGAAPESSAPNYRKQSLNIYTVMLIISFVCLLAAIIVLAVNLQEWENLPFPYRTNSAAPVFNWISLPTFFAR